jgi:hypothetical protein
MSERTLAELDASIRTIRNENGNSVGVRFRCPTCPDSHRHHVTVTWSGPSLYEGGAVWKLESAPELAVLTLSPSVNCDVPQIYSDAWTEEEKREAEKTRCRFHGWVRDGKVIW